MEPTVDSLTGTVDPGQEFFVRSKTTSSPEEVDILRPKETEEMLSLDGRVQGDDPHAVLPAVVPSLGPGEPEVALPPGQQVSLTVEVVVPTAGTGDRLDPQRSREGPGVP